MTHDPIYLDFQATTPLDPRVLEDMLPFFTTHYGNAASTAHDYGQKAALAVETSRERIAQHINGSPLGLVFTSGATESINLALKGLADFYSNSPKNHVITCQTEHPAVLDCFTWLETKGFEVTYLPVNAAGHLNLEQLTDTITDQTLAISIMFANNETGVLHDVASIGTIAKQKGVFFHCDAVQAIGKLPLDVETMGIDLLSFSGHKIYGPKGIGGLWVRRKHPRVRLGLQIHGGGHERGFRSGTLNVPGIVGLSKALDLCLEEQASESKRLENLRQEFLACLYSAQVSVDVNGDLDARLPHNLNLRFTGISAAKLMNACPQLAISRGSACTSAVPSPSRVLLAMGLSAQAASESLRISFGRTTTRSQSLLAAKILVNGVESLKQHAD